MRPKSCVPWEPHPIDFTAACDHQMNWRELYALPSTMARNWAMPQELKAFLRDHARDDARGWGWSRDRTFSSVQEELFETNHLTLAAPHGFACTVFRSTMEINHLARWWSFLHERDIHLGLLRACRAIAGLVGARHLVFLPDSSLPPSVAADLLFEGCSIETLLAHLSRHVGEPRPLPGSFLDRPDSDLPPETWFHDRLGSE